MRRYLLDTSIVAFLFRGKYGIGQHLSKLGAERCCVSDVTVAELTYGAYHSDRVQWNLDMIYRFTEMVTVVPFATGVDEYGRQKDRLVKMGQMIEDFDLFIGCTAVANGLVMVTDNEKHFARIEGIEIENWVDKSK